MKFEELKEEARSSIQEKRGEGWYFTTDSKCPECGKPNSCDRHKWRYLTYQMGIAVSVVGGISKEDSKHYEIRDKIASQLSEELEIE